MALVKEARATRTEGPGAQRPASASVQSPGSSSAASGILKLDGRPGLGIRGSESGREAEARHGGGYEMGAVWEEGVETLKVKVDADHGGAGVGAGVRAYEEAGTRRAVWADSKRRGGQGHEDAGDAGRAPAEESERGDGSSDGGERRGPSKTKKKQGGLDERIGTVAVVDGSQRGPGWGPRPGAAAWK